MTSSVQDQTPVRVNNGPAMQLPRYGGQLQVSPTLVSGLNTFTIDVTSETGATVRLVRRVNYDIQAPVAVLLAPTAGSTVSGIITVRTRVTDNYGPVINVGLSRDGSGIRSTTRQADGTHTVELDTRELIDRPHTLDFWMNDGVGNFTIQSFNIFVDN